MSMKLCINLNVFIIWLKYFSFTQTISTDTICYDDACHLKKFSQNSKRCSLTATSRQMSRMNMYCDKFHFKNHVDSWCKKNCNPYKSDELKVIITKSPKLRILLHKDSFIPIIIGNKLCMVNCNLSCLNSDYFWVGVPLQLWYPNPISAHL